MELTEFLKYYDKTKPETFGEFVHGRRKHDLHYSAETFAQLLGIGVKQLRAIESGEKVAPIEIIPILLYELRIAEEEKHDFMDLYHLSEKSWPHINDYLAKRPFARKFLEMAYRLNLSDNFFKQLIEFVKRKFNKTNPNSSTPTETPTSNNDQMEP